MRFLPRHRTRRPAFTVLEITVVLCTIVILISLLLPAIQQAREQARRHQCLQNLAQMGIALRAYHDAHRCLPSGVVNSTGPVVSRTHGDNMFGGGQSFSMGGYGDGDYGMGGDAYGDGAPLDGPMDSAGNRVESPSQKAAREKELKKFDEIRSEYLLSWIAQILPQLDRQTTYRQIDFQTPQLSFVSKKQKKQWEKQYQSWTTVGNAAVPWFPTPEPTDLPLLHCPSRVSGGVGDALVATHYAGCYSSKAVPIDTNNDGLLYLNSSESLEDIPDGASTTILVGEAADGLFRSYYYGDHSSLRATEQAALLSKMDRYVNYGQRRGGLAGDEIDLTKDPMSMGFSAPHNVVTQFLFADGAAQSISTMIDAEVFAKLGSRNDGTPVSTHSF